MNPCIAYYNLSAAADHYGTHNNLCSTVKNSWEACPDLSTGTNLKLNKTTA
jgi:hypothetical protein